MPYAGEMRWLAGSVAAAALALVAGCGPTGGEGADGGGGGSRDGGGVDPRDDAPPGTPDGAGAEAPIIYGVEVPATVAVGAEESLSARLGTKAGHRLSVAWTTSAGVVAPATATVTADATGNALVEATFTAPAALGAVELTLTVDDEDGGTIDAVRTMSIERAAAYTLGVTESWPDDPDAFLYTRNRLLAQAIVVPRRTELQGLGVIANVGGPQMRTAIYTDDGGTPDRLVTTGTAVTLVAGANVAPVPTTVLEPGTYWLGTLFDRDADLAEDTPRRDESRRHVLYGFKQSWQSTFPNPLTSTGPTASFFLVVQDPPPP